jgi:GNAT superfamily N-acetyltransferase
VTAPPIRSLRPADLPACVDLAADRDWAPDPDKWQLLLDLGEVFGIDDPGGGLAGAVGLTPFGPDLAAVGMMLVAARRERQGLGRALMLHVLARAGRAVTFLLATGAGRPLYEHLGFQATDRLTRYIGPFTAPAGAVNGNRAGAVAAGAAGRGAAAGGAAAGGVAAGGAADGGVADGGVVAGLARPVTDADLPGIAALDRLAFGADRTAVLARVRAAPGRFLVIREPDGLAGGAGPAVRGFAAAGPLHGMLVIGPVVARDLATATALITALADGADGPVWLEAPGRHPGLGEWAAARGLTVRSHTTLMTFGGDLPGAREHIFGPVNMALG